MTATLHNALEVATKATDPALSHGEFPSYRDMRAALGTLSANIHTLMGEVNAAEDKVRHCQEEIGAWKELCRGTDTEYNQLNEQCERLNGELDRTQGHWSDLMEFIRTGLGLDERATDKVDDVRAIIGNLIKDSRLLSRVRDEVNGTFVAGQVMTTDGVKTLTDAVKASRKTSMGTAATEPATEHFMPGAPEPVERVQRVKRPQGDTTFIRFGHLSDGTSLWRRAGDHTKTYLTWPEVVRFQEAVEVPE